LKTSVLWLLAFAAPGGALFAQNITGTWQGSLQGPQGRPPLRLVVKVSRTDDEKLKAVFYSIDQGAQPINASAMSQDGSSIKMGIAAIGGNYEGKLSPDGDSISFTPSFAGDLRLHLMKRPRFAWSSNMEVASRGTTPATS